MKTAPLLLLTILSLLLSACAATGIAISKRNLDVQTKMSDSIFLDPPSAQSKRVLVQVRNTSDKPNFSIQREIEAALTANGWSLVRDPEQAQYLLQANILQVGKNDPTAAEQMFHSGYGGVWQTGAVAAGAVAVAGNNSYRSIAGAGILAGATEFVSGQMVKDVYYSAITDLQISQRTKNPVKSVGTQRLAQGSSGSETIDYAEDSNWKRYRTRILSSANQVNLDWDKAQPELIKGLSTSIAGVF